MTPDADSFVVKVTRKCCRNSTEKAHRPRAFPSTAGLSGNYQLLDNALSVFDELALHSRPMVFDEEIAKVVCLGFIRKRQHVNAGTDLQPHAGHLLPRTQRYSDAHDCRWEEGNTKLLWNMREEQVTTTTLPA